LDINQKPICALILTFKNWPSLFDGVLDDEVKNLVHDHPYTKVYLQKGSKEWCTISLKVDPAIYKNAAIQLNEGCPGAFNTYTKNISRRVAVYVIIDGIIAKGARLQSKTADKNFRFILTARLPCSFSCTVNFFMHAIN
jgi:hypothetical protein